MALTQPDFLPGIFAADGNYQDIPDDDAQTGRMSWAEGFPIETSTPLASGGVPPRRIDMNGLGYRLSEFLFFMQSGSLFSWSATLDYSANAHVVGSDGREYIASQASGPNETIGAVNPVTDVNFTVWKPWTRNIVDIIYPVGSIYLSVSATSPATLFGGTWQRIQGRYLLASDGSHPAASTGGSNSVQLTVQNLPAHSHTVTIAEAGQHNHTATTSSNGNHTHDRGTMDIIGTVRAHYNASIAQNGATGAFYNPGGAGRNIDTGGSNSGGAGFNFQASRAWTGNTSQSGNHNHTLTTTTVGNHTHTVTVANTGGGQAISIMPAYFAVNVWQRTA